MRLPAVIVIASWFVGGALVYAVIWTAHIAFDRTLGYGLKLPAGFHHTHLGRIGRPGNQEDS